MANIINITKEMPHDYEAEKLVLGTIILERNALNEVRELLSPATFYDKFHSTVFQAILSVDARGERPDMIMVNNELRKIMGDDFPHADFLMITGYYCFDLYQHALLLQEKEQRRRFFELGQYLTENCFSEALEIGEVLTETRSKLDNLLSESPTGISTIYEAVDGVYKQINLNMQGETSVTGAPTGFRQLDKQSGGFQKSDLIVIAGETSMGKTSMAVSMIMNTGRKVAFYSMEMKKEQIAARMMAIESGIPANEILYKCLTADRLTQVDKGVHRILDKQVYFDDRSTANIDMILASIRTMKLKYDIDGVVIDYLQILNVNLKGATKEQQMGEATRRLKNLAKELDIWIIALSQLNRDLHNPLPSLNRLRDSGQIAEAADVVMLIYRPEVYARRYPSPYENAPTKGTALIDVAKGRNIGLLKFICMFDRETTRFYDDDRKAILVEEETGDYDGF